MSPLKSALAAAFALLGAIAIHALPPAEARVETVLIRRRDAYVSSALAAFLRHAVPEPARDAA